LSESDTVHNVRHCALGHDFLVFDGLEVA
jgi:hypothetical protein